MTEKRNHRIYLAHIIAKERGRQRLSQARFAKKYGVTQSRVSQIESGYHVSYDCYFDFLRKLGVEVRVIARPK